MTVSSVRQLATQPGSGHGMITTVVRYDLKVIVPRSLIKEDRLETLLNRMSPEQRQRIEQTIRRFGQRGLGT